MRLIVTFTTIPSRINTLKKTIKSLLNQTQKIDMIYLNISNFYSRFNTKIEKIPDYLLNFEKDNSNFKLNFCKDYGSATKLLGICDIEKSDDTCIIVVDDDGIYNKNMASEYLKFFKNYNNKSIICCSGIYFPEKIKKIGFNDYIIIKDHGKLVDIAEGTCGYILQRKMIKKDIFTFFINKNFHNSMIYRCDDYVFARYFNLHNVNIRLLKNKILNRNNCRFIQKKADQLSKIEIDNKYFKPSTLEAYWQCSKEIDKIIKNSNQR